jgi:pullulanase/glycogen debranching enzyme
LTQLRDDRPSALALRTFAWLAAPAVIEHLKRLGVTALEFFPSTPSSTSAS